MTQPLVISNVAWDQNQPFQPLSAHTLRVDVFNPDPAPQTAFYRAHVSGAPSGQSGQVTIPSGATITVPSTISVPGVDGSYPVWIELYGNGTISGGVPQQYGSVSVRAQATPGGVIGANPGTVSGPGPGTTPGTTGPGTTGPGTTGPGFTVGGTVNQLLNTDQLGGVIMIAMALGAAYFISKKLSE